MSDGAVFEVYSAIGPRPCTSSGRKAEYVLQTISACSPELFPTTLLGHLSRSKVYCFYVMQKLIKVFLITYHTKLCLHKIHDTARSVGKGHRKFWKRTTSVPISDGSNSYLQRLLRANRRLSSIDKTRGYCNDPWLFSA